MKYRKFLGLAAVLALTVPTQRAQAYTQCSATISKIFSGDNGFIWLFFVQGGSTYIAASDPDHEATLTMAMTALVASRPVTLRYTENSATCAAVHSDLEGFFME